MKGLSCLVSGNWKFYFAILNNVFPFLTFRGIVLVKCTEAFYVYCTVLFNGMRNRSKQKSVSL